MLGDFCLNGDCGLAEDKRNRNPKSLGASVTSIFSLLAFDFIKLVLIALFFAIPFAWYGMHRWLQDFAYPISMEWWIFILAGFSALLIAFFTIGVQSLKAALNNPVDSLHND